MCVFTTSYLEGLCPAPKGIILKGNVGRYEISVILLPETHYGKLL